MPPTCRATRAQNGAGWTDPASPSRRTLAGMSSIGRLRERLALGPVVRYLDGDDEVVAWTHANVPEVRAPALLVVTRHYCLLHVASSAVPDIPTPLSELSGFALDRRNPEMVRVRLSGQGHDLDVELSLTNRVRSRSLGRVLSALSYQQVPGPDSFRPELTSPVPPMPRGMRQHARRVWVTVLGVLVLMVSALFASPFFPGPGALTAVAGIAILAREYEWARDLHVWASRLADRFMAWMRRLRRRRRARTAEPTGHAPARPAPSPRVLEAEVAPPGQRGRDDRTGGSVAS